MCGGGRGGMMNQSPLLRRSVGVVAPQPERATGGWSPRKHLQVYRPLGGFPARLGSTGRRVSPLRPMEADAGLCTPLGSSAPLSTEESKFEEKVATKAALVKKEEMSAFRKMRMERKKSIKREQFTYMVAAIGATMLMAFLAVFATYYRFVFLMGGVKNFPWIEFGATLALVVCGMAAMEMYARFAHKVLWHDFKPGWALHKSHHEPRTGPFEANDLYAVANAVPAISLCAYGFFHTGLLGGLCFGCGLGITLFGIMYMFVHDGLVHKRFPVGPIANVPYLRRVAAAHRLHHSDRYDGYPWGMFLGMQELQKYPEALKEVEALVAAAARENRMRLKQELRKMSVKKSNGQEGNGGYGKFAVPMAA